MDRKLNEDPEFQSFWQSFARVGQLAGSGLLGPALDWARRVRQHPRQKEFDPEGQTDYTYAVLLLQTSNDPAELRESVEILEDCLARARGPQSSLSALDTQIEVAAAWIRLGEFQAAVDHLVEVIHEAKEPMPLAYQNLGQAYFGTQDFDSAEKAFLEMVDATLNLGTLGTTGVAAEWLARVQLERGDRAGASAWAKMAEDAYREHAPKFLSTLRQLAQLLTEDEGPLAELPPQAQKIREKIPRLELGSRAGDHLDALYLDLGAIGLALASENGVGSSVAIPLGGAPEGHRALRSLLAAELGLILPHSWLEEVLESLVDELWPRDRRAEISKDLSPSSLVGNMGSLRLLPPLGPGGPAYLNWSSADATPACYGVFVSTLAKLFLEAHRSRQESTEALEEATTLGANVQRIDLSSRAWPRPIDQRFIAYGQNLVSSTLGVAELAGEVTRLRLQDPELNQRDFGKIHYSPEQSRELHEGGLIALLASEIISPGAPPPSFIGTAPLNELNAANLPPDVPLLPDEAYPGFVIDREYNTWFWAPSPSRPDAACYGADNTLLRDHFEPFQKQVEIVDTLRAKHWSVPVIQVDDLQSLQRIVGLLDQATERLRESGHAEPDARTLYRGQTELYTLERTARVSRFLYGKSDVVEPSLPGAAPRRGLNYFKVHSLLSVLLQGLIYRKAAAQGEPLEETYNRWARFVSEPGAWDLGVMLLAQHYGVPTHGIDVTHDIDVALWFATHAYTSLQDGSSTYRPLTESHWQEKSPVIFAVLPVTHSLKSSIRDVDLFAPLGLNAPRPIAQKACFFMGAHGLHRNRLAEALVCALRLQPGVWDCSSTYEALFPPPEEDEIYSWILGIQDEYRRGEIGRFLDFVPRYSYD